MDIQQDNKGKPGTITGDFYCSHQEPVFDTASNNNNDTAKEKNVSKIPSRCELNCEEGSLFVYELSDSMKTPFLILPKIRKVSRHKHDKEIFCLEYGTETNRFNIFLTIEDKSDADQWELKLCNITGQTPHVRRRAQTVDRPIRPNKNYTLSSPSAPEGFSLAEQDGTNDTNDTLTLPTHRASQRDGQRSPKEGDIRDVVGPLNVSPTPSPGNSPKSCLSDEDPNEAHVDSVLDETNLTRKLKEHQQQKQQRQEEVGQEQHATRDEILSEMLPLVSVMSIPQSSDHQLPRELRPTEPPYQCTHVEIECSQEKSSLTINQKDFLDTDDIDDMFVCYRGSVYLKSCPESFQSQLFIGTRILQVNNQEPVDARRAIDYITTSAGQTVDLLVQLFPLGVRVRLCVPSVAALGITQLLGNEIMNMHKHGVMSRIADGLRCVCPALSTTDMPSPSAEQRSITAIGDCHVPFDATADEVKDMLDSAIKSGNGHLVLQLQPTEFCQAIAPNALQRRIVEENCALLNPRPNRRPSLVQSLMSNPPS